MNLTLETVQQMLADGWRPTRGRCFIHLDAPPTMAGLLHIPERSQEIQIKDTVWRGTILAINYKTRDEANDACWDDVYLAEGDRVLLLLRAEDMDRTVVITDNTRIVAVIGE